MNYIDTITILSRKERKQEICIFNLIFPEGMRTAQLINFLVDSLHSGQHGSIDMIECLHQFIVLQVLGTIMTLRFVQMQFSKRGKISFNTIASYDSKTITINHMAMNILRGSSAMFTASVFLVK